jgi:hypothetical protein
VVSDQFDRGDFEQEKSDPQTSAANPIESVVPGHQSESRPPSPSSKSPSTTSDATPDSKVSTDKISVASDEYDTAMRYEEVWAQVDVAAPEEVALRVRKQKVMADKGNLEAEEVASRLSCVVGNAPMCGSNNILFPVTFSDGAKWLVRIPGHGDIFWDLDKIKMDTEFQTMRYIKNNTSMLLPVVYYRQFESTEIGSAFALMEWITRSAVVSGVKEFNERQRF